MSDRKSHGFDGFEFSGVGGGAASGSFFGANASSTLRRMLSAVEPFTNTDKTVAMTSFGGGENVLQNFTLQTNFHRQGQQRAKRKRKESSFSSCSSSSSASTLLSLVAQGPPTSAERRFPPPPTTSAAGVGEENSFGVGGGGSSVEEQSGQQKNGKSLLGGKTADLNESTSVAGAGGGVDYYNRSSEPPAQDVGEDEQTDSPRRKRPKYDYTRDQMFEVNRLLLFSSSAFGCYSFCCCCFCLLAFLRGHRRGRCVVYAFCCFFNAFVHVCASLMLCDCVVGVMLGFAYYET